MDFRKLQAFCKVYENRSFSRAGQELYLSQPTISAHVMGLESDLGVNLFDRLGRTIMPTGAAEVLYKAASDVFRRLDLARSEIELIQNRVSGEIIIGGSTIPAHWILPEIFSSFSQRYPEVTFALSVEGTSRIIDKVISGELEIGMVGAHPEHVGMVVTPVLEDEIVAVAHPDMMSRFQVHSNPIQEWPWVMRERNCGTRLAFEKALSQAGKNINSLCLAVRVQSTQAVLAYAKAGLGVGAISLLAAKAEIESGELLAIDLGLPPIKRFIYLIHLQERTLFPATRTFLHYAQQAMCEQSFG